MTLRLALVAESIFDTGGMQNHSRQLIKHLSEQIYMDIYTTDSPPAGFGTSATFVQVDRPRFPGMPGHYIAELLQFSRNVQREMRGRPPVDWIYVQGLSGLSLLREAPPHRPMIAVNPHGLEMFQPAPTRLGRIQQILLRKAARRAVGNADLVLSLGGKLTDIIASLGVPASRIDEVPLGIEPESLPAAPSPPHSPRRLIFVGRDERRKGLDELLRAIPERESAGRDFELTIVGPHPRGRDGADPRVRFVGPVVERNRLMYLLLEHDIIVCPSWSEGMPTVILEGMTRGLGVVATDVGATRLLVSGGNGWLVPPGDTRLLRAAVVDALGVSDAELWARKKESLRSAGHWLSWQDVAERTMSVLYSRGPVAIDEAQRSRINPG